MNYQDAIDYIHNTHKFGMKLGLDNIKRLLMHMGNPQSNLKFIHVAGTNGKGSICAFINSILFEAGFKVGLYTSPYLEEFEERMRINNQNIPKDKLIYYVEYIKPIIEKLVVEGYNHPTEFEIITAIAFKYFCDENVDFVVLEVGLGGRFDATNVIDSSLVSVITTIDYDHMDKLGDTLEKIAFEKAGIIKENGTVVSFYQKDEALKVIEEVSRFKNASLSVMDINDVKIKESNSNHQVFDYKNYKNLKISIIGKHQIYNASLAVMAVEKLIQYGINISEDVIKRGLINAKWPGRIEVISKLPLIVIDGAHNPQGMAALKEALNLFTYNRLILVIGMLKDKDTDSMLKLIVPEADLIITTKPISDRAYTAEELSQKIAYDDVLHFENIDDAINEALKSAGKNDLILFCGSLYMIGHVRMYLKNVIK
ncbi:bifunctional folylpolyglutamate synthase/dihydrofolate synthase [Thermoanaerobacterium thermosaccharolyticum]|uniref:Dihydrofolate synthase/folylpolyglutamate synthase n=2 Tax=Thermoanaerobacterium thermosaccharolyticum TaxID=1517 RepID=D9TN44_THETC|nr:folylpolyglutamate synthase/dihydrofolate synthase family protein [Thermoanaerobacterium thermosaccharolyticum]ADL68567.1 FolC bifunctional protein [Thermoanaerobacterium thermosaccharolyticum DSM 571]OXT09377.1 bifunctional folylpolyglutamate synthase/dihydrofolate synthase [Thermoanaerobacterium thermosaccharolyticum]PHO07810.1 bifunctional folylpolyglutamate synthase/dihydrofolate synthase [Thermoanaerobacterium thermosaccharolyticum]